MWNSTTGVDGGIDGGSRTGMIDGGGMVAMSVMGETDVGVLEFAVGKLGCLYLWPLLMSWPFNIRTAGCSSQYNCL